MGEEEKTVKVERRDGRLFIEGTDEEYRVPIRTFRLNVTKLHGRTSLEDGDKPALSGRAKLEEGDKISVIGADEPEGTELSLYIHPWRPKASNEASDELDETEYDAAGANEQSTEVDDPFGLLKDDRPKNVSIGFTASDWEIGNDSDYFVDVRLAEPLFNRLRELIAAGDVERIHLGIKTYELFVRAYDFHAPPSVTVTWFLQPDRRGRVNWPRLAHGVLDSLNVVQKGFVIAQVQKVASDEEDQDTFGDEQNALAEERKQQAVERRGLVALESIARAARALPWVVGISALIIAIALQ